jgi:transcriptional regulator
MVKIDNKGKITISLTVKIDFGQGTKKKAVIYEFTTTKQNVSVLEKLKKQMSSMGE